MQAGSCELLTASSGEHHITRTVFWAARDVGPAREGIQKKPSVSRPSSATFDSALQDSTYQSGEGARLCKRLADERTCRARSRLAG